MSEENNKTAEGGEQAEETNTGGVSGVATGCAKSGEGEMKAENDNGKEKTKGAARRFARALVPMFVGAVSALVVYYGIGAVFAYMNRIGATQAQSIIAVLFVTNIVGISIFQAFQIALLRRRVRSAERDEMMTLALIAGLHALCGAVINYLDSHTESHDNANPNPNINGDAGNGRAEDAPNAEVALKAENKDAPKAEGKDAPVKKSEPDETARTKPEKPLQAAPSKDDAKPASENVKKPEAKKEDKKDESEKFQGFM